MTIATKPQEQKVLALPKLKLVYRYWKNLAEDAVPLVFIHGWAGSADDWQKLVATCVAQGESVLVYDAAGFGQSQFESKQAAKEADYSLQHYVEELKILLEAENIGKARLVGHSWGGVVAMSFAARYPTQTESLVVIGSAYFDPHKFLHQVLKWASYLIAWVMVGSKPLLRRSSWLRRLAVRRYLFRPLDNVDSELLIKDALESDNQAVVQTLLSGYAVLFKEICPRLECPVLYIGSDHDVVAPLSYVEAFVPLTPHARFVAIKDCGHFPMLEKPDELWQILKQFPETAN